MAATGCFHPAADVPLLGKHMADEFGEGEFGPPLYYNDGTPLNEHNVLLTKPPCGSSTIFEVAKSAAERGGPSLAVGQRRLLNVHKIEEGGKTFEKLELANEYDWITYDEYWHRVVDVASGLVSISQIPEQGKVVIYAETQRDWMVSALAAYYINCQVVTIYATLGEEGAEYGLNQTKASVCFVDAKLMKIITKIAPKLPNLKHIITLGDVDAPLREKCVAEKKVVTTYDELIARGRESKVEPRPPKPEDLAVVMYTSGTTGAPKGVLLTHRNVVAGVAGFRHCGATYDINEKTVFLAYLPLAHIMEMIAEVSMLAFGGQLAYGSPHTLTDTGVKLKRPESMGDALIARPTFMVFAPAVFDKVYKAVLSRAEGLPGWKRAMFDKALNWGFQNYDQGGMGVNALLNKVIFGNVQATLGGRLRLAMTGSAPLSAEIQKFMQTVLKCPVRQGYGLTENCACASIGTVADNSVKSVGPPQACTVLRLADWPEGNYLNADKKDVNIGMARGEVLVGGATVCEGYYVDPENPDPEITKKNAEEFVTIGGTRYFRTGDIGQITPSGTLQIIDRKKDLWKGPNGEYVSLSKVESALKLSPYVDIPMVYGKTGGDYPISLCCVVPREIIQFGEAKGLGNDVTALCMNPQVVAEVSRSAREKCKEQALVEFEIPKKIVLLPPVDGAPAWTPENDFLTAAMKLKRPGIVRAFQEQINAAYA